MSDVTIVLIGGLGAAIAWGISDYFAARSTQKIGPTLASAVVNILGTMLFLAIYFAFFRDQPINNFDGVMYSSVAGIVLGLGAFAFFRALKKGPVSIVSPLTSLYPLVTTLLAVAVFGANLSQGQILGIVIIVVGVLAASGLLGAKKTKKTAVSGLKYALLTATLWGVGYSLLAQGIARIGWQAASMIEFLFVAVVFVTITPLLKGNEVINAKTIVGAMKNKYVIGAAIIQMIGVLALNYGLSKESSSGAIVTALSACYPLLTVFLALKNMKEKIVVVPLIGAFVGIFGVIIVVLN